MPHAMPYRISSKLTSSLNSEIDQEEIIQLNSKACASRFPTEFALVETAIVTHGMARFRSHIKLAEPHKKDTRQLKGELVLTGKQIQAGIEAVKNHMPVSNSPTQIAHPRVLTKIP
jgi:hypothetical protein